MIKAYNHCLGLMTRTETRQFEMVRFTDTNLERAQALWEWLDDESITPMAYLASCFAKHAWARRPQFKNLLGERYKRHFELNSSDAYLWAAAIIQDIESKTPIDLPVGKEIVKKRLIRDGGHDYCRNRWDLTGGFNDLSPLCKACPHGKGCR